MNVAQKCREEKEKHPERYCADKRCLWRVVRWDGTPNPCRNHPHLNRPKATEQKAEA